MAVSKSQKIEAEIEKVKAKISRPGSRSWNRKKWRRKTPRSWTSCGA